MRLVWICLFVRRLAAACLDYNLLFEIVYLLFRERIKLVFDN